MLEAKNLRVALPDRSRKPVFGKPPLVEIIKGIDLQVSQGECVGVVGESGSGKSTLARALIRLYQPTGGTLTFQGDDITNLGESALQPYRQQMQMVFQDSQSALNPRRTLGDILAEPFLVFGHARTAKEAADNAADLITEVGLPKDFLKRYAHQLSGGQRQRIGLARAIALRPSLVIADEIVSGLDVSVQAQILELLNELRARTGMGVVLISHDLSVVRAVCDRIVVMRSGQVVETGDTKAVFAQPEHAYTRKLLRAIPLPEVDPHWLDTADQDEEVGTAAAGG
ncbi:ATP-binding cassette domain-containing protein [Variovorax sp. VNK109]|uniref:ATP-binding cassette domain-containing protein n=1 Tax=Variovorax sp. VNK109 TaxID=3400919 RepID=UPI003BFC929A